ncbi:MAG: tyrosine-type recombinase/integrase [Actinobacteria bacterium]|nr:tyrosine-type recombinase/integrase [Actinomycetota bacterium]
MANRSGKRAFGHLRKLPSGRFQASYINPAGLRQRAPDTFESRAAAGDWLTVQESTILQQTWTDPTLRNIAFGPYAERWIKERAGLRPRTIQLYEWMFERYLKSTLGPMNLSAIDPAVIRSWRLNLLTLGNSETMVAKAYRLLRAIFNTAVEDELIRRNPCRITGGGTEKPSERPVLELPQVVALAALIPQRQRSMILLATFASLRYGEVTALQRADVDFEAGTVSINHAFTEVPGRGLVLGPPKSRAGVRTIAVPSTVMAALKDHFQRYVSDSPDAFVFTGVKGKPIRRSHFNGLVDWKAAVAEIGVPQLHFHDLRHTGNTLAASSGVSTRDLMARMGHDSMNAALIYQHATKQADKKISDSLDARLRAADGESGS